MMSMYSSILLRGGTIRITLPSRTNSKTFSIASLDRTTFQYHLKTQIASLGVHVVDIWNIVGNCHQVDDVTQACSE